MVTDRRRPPTGLPSSPSLKQSIVSRPSSMSQISTEIYKTSMKNPRLGRGDLKRSFVTYTRGSNLLLVCNYLQRQAGR
ncbi:hypothetical protein L1987_54194 [Smallanthus sonchifolius]|uniref:Uncharacterized protein n=1 Tax=Smallanthus sonchifolius TaxID=185202 RepID=A0ACB9E6K0_9ASTR|nr:hypothetical protein L1987_54194 [Smallanthus sonchifolius]